MGAVDLKDLSYTQGNETATTTDTSFTFVTTIDAKALKNLLEKGQSSDSWGTGIIVYDLGDVMSNEVKQRDLLTGIVINGSSSGGKIAGSSLWAKWDTNNAWGNFMNYEQYQDGTDASGNPVMKWRAYDLADLNGDAEGTGWDVVAGAGITYTYDSANGSKCALTLCDASGEVIFSHVYTFGGLKSASSLAGDVTFGDMVTVYYYSDTVLSEADAKQASVLAAVQSIPEPATATLSLLALAGLAARRRRK